MSTLEGCTSDSSYGSKTSLPEAISSLIVRSLSTIEISLFAPSPHYSAGLQDTDYLA